MRAPERAFIDADALRGGSCPRAPDRKWPGIHNEGHGQHGSARDNPDTLECLNADYIPDPNKIFPGDVIHLPDPAGELPDRHRRAAE